MPDSKISELPLSPYLLDRDLMVVVTGNSSEGAYPQNCKVPVSYIRRYITRPNLFLNTISGVDGHYHADTNILDICVTGLNAYGGNFIQVDYASNWPYSGIISTTGLNVVSNKSIGYKIEPSWPHKYELLNTERVKHGSLVSIQNNNTTNTNTAKHNILRLDYSDFYQSSANQTLSLLGTACFKVSNIIFANRPNVPGVGSLNSQKISEILPISGSTISYNHDAPNSHLSSSVTLNYNELSNFYPDVDYDYIANSFTLNIGISGEAGNNLITNIHSYPITFKNTTLGFNKPYYNTSNEIYRNNVDPYTVNGIDPIIIRAKLDVTINSSEITSLNSLALCSFITNIRATRIYTNKINFNGMANGYTYSTSNCYCATSATIEAYFLKGENTR